MPKKQRKVKRYRNIYRGSITSSPVFKAGAVVAGVAIVAVAGWLLYEPVYNWATNLGESVSQGSSSQTAEPSSSGGMLDGFLGGEEGSSSQSVPEATDPAAAQTLHAVYMPESILMDASARSSFIADCVANGYNSIYFDLKDSAGVVTYRSGLSQVTELGSVSASAVDLASVVSEMKNAGISPIGRIYAFQDPLAAAANLDAAVHYQDSEWAWLDNSASLGGQPWLNPVSDYAQQYIMDLAREAAAAGVQQIVLDAVTFPVGYSLEMASYGRTLSDAEKSQVLADFIAAVDEAVHQAGGESAVYLSAPTLLTGSTDQYGSDPFLLTGSGVLLGVMPASFGSVFSSADLAMEAPVQQPYQTVSSALAALGSQLRTEEVSVLLQGYTSDTISALMNKTYTAADVEEQIRAAQEAGYEDYVIFSPSGDYSILFTE